MDKPSDPAAMRPVTTPATGTPGRDGPPAGLPTIDVNEYGGKRGAERQVLNRRLFMQFLAFSAPSGADGHDVAGRMVSLVRERAVPAVVYADLMDPRGAGLLTWSEDPAHFVTKVRPLFATPALAHATIRPDMGMFGRSYSTGHEPDLAFVLLERPIANVMNEAYPWHVWYPLRRSGAFARLEPHDQGQILREHATIGMAYGQQELAHDIRLACHGLDAHDNEFVIGLVGRELHPLSHLIQAMRKTRQTAEFISQMGPFFVGHVVGRSG